MTPTTANNDPAIATTGIGAKVFGLVVMMTSWVAGSWTPPGDNSITADQDSHLPQTGDESAEILHLWFRVCRPWQWFRQSDAFDAEICRTFGPLTASALDGDLQSWENDPAHCLALVLMLDQFSRQIWRGSARAFAGQTRAERLSVLAVQRGWLIAEPERPRRQFWLMPLLHSETMETVAKAIPLLRLHADQATADVACRNLKLLRRFGRYPHRNAALGRISSDAERAYLNR